MQIKALVPLHIADLSSKDLEEMLRESLERFSFTQLGEKKISLSSDLIEKLQEVSDQTGIPVKHLIGMLLMMNYKFPKVRITTDVEEYLAQFRNVSSLPFPENFTIFDVYEMQPPKDVLWLSSSVVDKLYEMKFSSYTQYVLAFSHVLNEKRYLNPPEVYALMAPYSLEYVLPKSLFNPDLPVKEWLKFNESDDEVLEIEDVDQQIDIQEGIGRLLDTHYLDDIHKAIRDYWGNRPIPDWFYERPQSLKKFPENPILFGFDYRIAPVEYMLFNKLVGIDRKQGEKLSEFVKHVLQNEKRRVWLGIYKDYEIMGFRSGAFLIAKKGFKHPMRVVEDLREYAIIWFEKGVADPDLKNLTPYSLWHGTTEIPCYSVTSSIAMTALNHPKMWKYWPT